MFQKRINFVNIEHEGVSFFGILLDVLIVILHTNNENIAIMCSLKDLKDSQICIKSVINIILKAHIHTVIL